MTIYPIETGNLKLDGGAMFGVVPKTIWQKTNPADSNNLITLSMRSMLIEDGDRLILIDTGIGNKQSEKFFGHFHLFGDFSLEQSLAKHGFTKDDITDVFLTHLHFDHCGGSVEWTENKQGYRPAFKNATYWSNEQHWLWATEPNPREKASFLKENIFPIQESGQLKFVNKGKGSILEESPLNFSVLYVDGHTEKQMIPIIKYKGKTIVFAADMLPTVGHIPLAYVMGYDTRPLLTMSEKSDFLNMVVDNDYYIFMEHESVNELCTLKKTERGIRLSETFKWNEIF